MLRTSQTNLVRKRYIDYQALLSLTKLELNMQYNVHIIDEIKSMYA